MKVLVLPSPDRGRCPTLLQSQNFPENLEKDELPVRTPARALWEVRRELADLGVFVTDAEDSPDLIWVCGSYGVGGAKAVNIPDSLLDSGFPIVIDENERDGAEIGAATREYMRRDRVVGVVKALRYRPLSIYNQSHYGRPSVRWYHAEVIRRCAPERFGDPAPVLPELTETELCKIEVGTSYQFDVRGWFERDEIDLDAPRAVDACFSGGLGVLGPDGKPRMTLPPWDAVQWHRERAMASLQAIQGLEVVALGSYREGPENRRKVPLPLREYHALLRRSKICVSPWYAGERNIKDFEAAFCGCVLVKPDTSFAVSWPDIYRAGESYVPCRPDFADLEAVIRSVLQDWSGHREMRRRMRELVLRNSEREVVALHLKELLGRCLARS